MGKSSWMLALALAGCAYHSEGDRGQTKPGAVVVPAAPGGESGSAGSAAENHLPGASTASIKGIELFDRQVTVVTVVCSSHTYDIRYSHKAAEILTSKLNGAALTISRVDVLLRCHPKGFANFESRCHATTEIALNVQPTARAAPRSTVVKGDGEAGMGALCEGGVDAVNAAMDAALAEAVAQLR